jgi:asparagine synthetase B (glutamine-hydrolysing)
MGPVSSADEARTAAEETTPVTTGGEVFVELRSTANGVEVAGSASGLIGHPFATPDAATQGIFARWRWDGRCFELSTDRYGMYPLYWAHAGNTFRLASSIPALIRAGSSHELDEQALAVFFRLGFFVGDDTPFRAIHALPPGARVTWSPRGLEVQRHLPIHPPLAIDRSPAIDRYGELFRQAIERSSSALNPTTSVLPLSGGQDSRHILLELLEAGRPPSHGVSTRHFPPRGTPDAEVARDLARRAGVPHRVLEQPASQLGAVLRHHLVTNFCTLTPGYFMHAVNDFVAGRSAVVYDGLGGDVLSAGLFATPERSRLWKEGRFTALAEDLLSSFEGGGGYSEDTLRHTFDPTSLQRFARQTAVERLVRELEPHREAANPMLSFCFFNRTRRDVALLPCRVLSSASSVRTPYLDHALFDFLSALPAEICLDHAFHKDTIARRFPAFASFPFASYAVADDRRARTHFRRFAAEVFGYTRATLGIPALRRSSMMPRLAHCIAGGSYGKAIGWLGPLLLYLQQLQNLIGEGEAQGLDPERR